MLVGNNGRKAGKRVSPGTGDAGSEADRGEQIKHERDERTLIEQGKRFVGAETRGVSAGEDESFGGECVFVPVWHGIRHGDRGGG